MNLSRKGNLYRAAVTPGKMDWSVTVNGEPLPQRQDLRNHSPDGFAWGYGGSGPAQLALAILTYEVGEELALIHYQEFKRKFIAKMDIDQGFGFHGSCVGLWVLAAEAARRAGDVSRSE